MNAMPASLAAAAAPSLSAIALRLPKWDIDIDLLMRGAAKAVVVLALASFARWMLKRLARRVIARVEAGDPDTVSSRVQRATTLAQILTHVGMVVIVIAAGLLFLDIFINIGPLLAGAGVLGLALSLGGQGVMKDIVTGFLIVLEDQYAVGERIRIGDLEGTVHRLTLRATVLRADDGTLHYLSNGALTAVANLSRSRPARPRPGGAGAAAPEAGRGTAGPA
jgi:small conductance mechanosensitive channel